jgi:hypothetical protein
VGQALFLSPRTVGRHLSTAMRKLGVSTRTAAAMAAAEAGLIPVDADLSAARVSRSNYWVIWTLAHAPFLGGFWPL